MRFFKPFKFFNYLNRERKREKEKMMKNIQYIVVKKPRKTLWKIEKDNLQFFLHLKINLLLSKQHNHDYRV